MRSAGKRTRISLLASSGKQPPSALYRLTHAGHKLLGAEKRDWEQTAAIIAHFFDVKAEDLA